MDLSEFPSHLVGDIRSVLALMLGDGFAVSTLGCDGSPAQLEACRELARAGCAYYERGAYHLSEAGKTLARSAGPR